MRPGEACSTLPHGIRDVREALHGGRASAGAGCNVCAKHARSMGSTEAVVRHQPGLQAVGICRATLRWIPAWVAAFNKAVVPAGGFGVGHCSIVNGLAGV